MRCPAHCCDQLIGRKRLGEKIEGPAPERCHRHLHITMPGNEDDRNVRVNRMNCPHQLEPVHPVEPDIGDNAACESPVDFCQRWPGGGMGGGAVISQFERLHRGQAQGLVILDEDHA
nr:hypothetical protein [Qipengyuania sp. YIM B01966]